METSKARYKEIFDALASVRDEFEVRLYKWALMDAKREVDEDFNLLRRVKGASAMAFVAFAERLNAEDRLSLLYAQIKRRHLRAVELTKETIGRREEHLYNEESVSFRAGMAKGLGVSAPPQKVKIPRKELRKLLMARFAGRGFGEYDPWDLPGEWRYRLKVGSWIVETYIEVGATVRQLGYSHAIKGPEDVPLILHGLAAWFGAVGNTDWDMLTKENLPESVDDLIVLCRHFLDAVPNLLDGLEPPQV